MQAFPVRTIGLFVGVLALTAHSLDLATTSSLTFDEEGAKSRPVSKVIKLLKDMLKTLEKEADEDEETWDKMACWCETNDKEKTEAIKKAEARIADLTTKIESYTAASGRLNTEIKNLEKEKAANQAALDKATALRQKQLAEFNGEEKDLLESISALKAAIVVMEKHHSALLQLPRAHLMGIAASVQHEMQKHAALLKGVLTHSERRAVAAFAQAPADYFDATPTFKQAYAPQSGTIFGILKQMKETFESNLSASQKEELANQKAYDELKAAKEAEIAAGTEQIDKKTQELADTDFKNAQAKQDIEDTKNSLSADEQFLMMLKEKCSMTDAEHEERVKTRQMEMEAVSKALAVLSTDDAHDLFTKTFNSLLQQENTVRSARRTAASKLLASVSQKLRSPRLAALATKVKLDAFTQVKKAIDDMLAQLLKEKEAEIKQKDFCISEFDENTLQTEKAERSKASFTAKMEDLEMTIKTLTTDIKTLQGEIAEMKVQMKRGSEDREKENKDFSLMIADQRATQQLLVAALKVLKGFYAKEAAVLLQRQEPAGPAPPPGFKEYVNNEKSGGVMGMIQTIIDEAKAVEKEAIVAEADAQKAYEAFVKDTNESIWSKEKDVINKSESKAKAESDLVVATDGLTSAEDTLDGLAKYKGELHSSCDFVLKNFEIRQTARDEEVEALKQAKSILSGANFQAFLQG
mmetsp:Transcript_158031/g.288038  ORF Transcript_158031/g.288038 Transcript_158031/m.288038 type:complete len:695 (-) Transcript_158031:65-2149(-)